MNYTQSLDYLFSQLPMFHRIGAAAYKANLDNTISLCRILGNPGNKFPSVHIAGTNGKGSVSHIIASVLQEAGYKTGLYTSPHLKDFRERIRINGRKIPKSNITEFVKTYKRSFEPIQPSFFEYTFGMAARYFADEKVDIAVIETGMGGRLDSTNVVNSILTVISNIGYDHTQFLGDTLEKIAIEKAGIIKPGIPVIIGETRNETKDVFVRKAFETKSQICFADEKFKAANSKKTGKHNPKFRMDIYREDILDFKDLICDLTGNYQLKNIITAFQSVETLKSLGFEITPDHLRQGIKKIRKNTGLQGRWQILGRNPLIVCDTGHNVDGIKLVLQQLKETPHKTLHIVLGFVKDKNIDAIIDLLPKDACYYYCKANIPRGLDQDKLRASCLKKGLTGKSYPTVKLAFETAKKNADKEDLIFAGGSTFIVAEVI
jgi:dihydrofolate synthase/folylpolyglutamate synthase